MFALDTDTLIYFFKGMGRVSENLLATPPREIAVPAVVLYELEVGLAKSRQPTKRRHQLKTLLEPVRILPFAAEEARTGGRLRARLERAGTPISPRGHPDRCHRSSPRRHSRHPQRDRVRPGRRIERDRLVRIAERPRAPKER